MNPRPAALARTILFAHLLLSPIIFSKDTVEVFEYNKVAALLVAAIALSAYYLPRLRMPPRDPVSLGFLLFFASAAASTVFSISRLTSLLGAHESFAGLFTILAYTILFFATRAACRSPADARRLLGAAVIAAAVAATYQLVQVAKVDPIHWGRVSGYGTYIRPFATMGHPNFLSAYLAMAFPITAYFGLRAAQRRDFFALATFVMVGVLASISIVISISRGAWLALACVLVVIAAGACALYGRRGLAAIAAVIPLTAIGVIVLYYWIPGGDEMLHSIVDRSKHISDATTRKEIWKCALAMIRERPIFGWGLDAFQYAFEPKRTVDYWIVEWNGTPTKAHNEAIHILSTQGIFGGLAVLAITGGLLVAGLRAWRRAAPDVKPLLIAIFAGIVGFYVQDVVSFTVAGCGTLFVTFAAILSRLGGPEPAEPAAARDSPAWFYAALAAGNLVTAVAFFYNVGDSGPASSKAAAAAAEMGRAMAGLAILLAFGLASLAIASIETADEPAPDGAATAPPPRRRYAPQEAPPLAFYALEAALWVGAVLLSYYGVKVPYDANVACRESDSIVKQLPYGDTAWAQRLSGDSYVVRGEKGPEVKRGAIGAAEDAVHLDPWRELYWVKLGTAAQVGAKFAPTAEERRRLLLLGRDAFRRSIELVPVNSYNHANLGRLLGEMAKEGLARPAEAYFEFDVALAADENNAYFYVDAADTAMNLNDLKTAHRYAARGAEVYAPRPGYGGFAPPRAQLGYMALIEGHFEEAAKLLAEAAVGDWVGDVDRQVVCYVNLSTARFQLGRYAEAEAAAREGVRIEMLRGAGAREPSRVHPYYPEAHIALGKALAALGRRAEAIAEFGAVLAQQPENQRARDALKALGAPVPAPPPPPPSGGP